MSEQSPRSGRCAIVGRPNVGKSTLLNTLLGQKLAIATSKPQTTRTCILGVFVQDDPPTQIAFVDTPGLHRPRNALGRAIVEDAKSGLDSADVVVMMTNLDTKKPVSEFLQGADAPVLQIAQALGQPIILAINKIDKLKDKGKMLRYLQQAAQHFDFAAIVPLSALKGKNVPALISEIRGHLPEGLQYDPEQVTDKPERFFAAELVREAVIQLTFQEVPYAVAVVVESFEEEPAITRIHANVVVNRDSHKGIVIGKGGQMLKAIGTKSRLQIEQMLSRKVHLELFVKVVEGWIDNPQRVRDLTRADGN